MIPGSANPLLLASAAQAGGYAISRSLRFNSSDSAYLSRTPASAGNRKTWTWAGWVKRSRTGADDYLFAGPNDSTNTALIRFTSGNVLRFYTRVGSGDYVSETVAVYRDLAAWMHIVAAVDTTQASAANRVKLYVNGTAAPLSATPTIPQNSDTYINGASIHYIGALPAVSGYCSAYLADVHFIDGQALDPTSFGEFDSNGIWQPKAYTGTYPGNSFHLDFADNSTAAALGTDTSGNGNTWTVNNISVLQGTGNYVPAMSSSGALAYGTTFLNGFNGNITNGVYGPAGGTMTFSPSPGIAYTSSVEVITAGDAYSQASLNGATAVSTPNNTWTTLATGSGTISTIVFSDTNSSEPGFAAIRVDGVILTDYRAASANDSLVDVPTNGTETDTGSGGEVRGNYCTWNPLKKGSDVTLTNGNLDGSVNAGNDSVVATIGVGSGKWYWEVSVVNTFVSLGIANSSYNVESRIGFDSAGNSYGYDQLGRKLFGASPSSYGATFSTGDVIGVALDLDAGTIVFYKNGVSQGTAFSGLSGTYFPAVGDGDVGGSTAAWAANFGQRPFVYTAPSGFKALCTANLPAPVVTKPSEYMDVVTYTGNGSTQTISGLEFSPDLVWIKARSAATRHDVFDTVRGVQKFLQTQDTAAEATDTNALDAFLSDGFSLGNDGPTNGSGVSFVAWTWDAGSSTVTNNDGSITSQVRANPSAGFSIVSYTGTGSASTIGHGLNVEPSMMLVKIRSNAFDWAVYHESLGGTKYLALNTTDAAGTATGRWNDTDPTSSVFSVSGSSSTNGSGFDYIAYCFAPVDGYSAMGSFSGGSGIFTYTGFRPKWLLIKQSSAVSSWIIYDTSRDTYNVMGNSLYPNLSDAEISSPPRIDFVSNGFVTRAASGSAPSWTGTVIYFAIAESPFNYARAR